MWSGRFREPTSKAVQRFTSSVWYDKVLCYCDAKVLEAYNRMLWLSDIISSEEFLQIASGLFELRNEMKYEPITWRIELEDVHKNLESRLISLIGRPGRKIHTGKSRNDQVTTVLRLWLRHKANTLIQMLEMMVGKLVSISKRHLNTMFPGMTHSQIAQPITFSHHALSYVEMIKRDIRRIRDCSIRAQNLPLGSAALAGSNYKSNRPMLADLLGFDGTCLNSLDAVSDRDFVIEYQSCLAVIMVHLSRLSEEIVGWLGSTTKLIKIGDSYCTGSSIMPQKKNPDVLELIRGKAGRIVGNLTNILVTMKAQNLAYNKDNQEDKRITFEGTNTLLKGSGVLCGLLTSLQISFSQSKRAAASNFSTATDLADLLVSQGLTFRDAHEATARIVKACLIRKKGDVTELDVPDLRGMLPHILLRRIGELGSFGIKSSTFKKNQIGSTSPKWVVRMIRSYGV
jgi:argininosuccinate lyase